ncbi:MAG: NAD(P)/FAD-dependent oxidoreductase [Bdellovibrionota bacterium]
MENTEISIIGGGLIGLTVAWTLAKNNIKVTVFEKDTCGAGASSYSLGVLGYPSPLRKTNFHKAHRISLKMTENFYKEIESESKIPLDYARIGSLEIIPGEAQYKQALAEVEYTQSTECDSDTPRLEIIPKDELEKLEPNIKLTEFGAIYAKAFARLSVDKTIKSIKQACIINGVTIKENTPVKELIVENNKAIGIKLLNGEKVYSQNILIASGAWSGSYGKEAAYYAYMEGIRGQAIEVKSETRLASHIIKYNKGYIIPSLDDTYGIGSTTEKNVGFDSSATVQGFIDILTRAKETLPIISNAKINRHWAGLRPAGRDRKPHIGKVPTIDGLFIATGHYKIGFGYAPITCDIIKRQMLGEEIPYPIDELIPRNAEPLNKKNK